MICIHGDTFMVRRAVILGQSVMILPLRTKKIISLEAFQSTPQARSRAYLNQQPCTELNQIYDDGQE
jgi:hypothetical protein